MPLAGRQTIESTLKFDRAVVNCVALLGANATRMERALPPEMFGTLQRLSC